MHHYNYERLSAQDNDFLLWESPTLPMHGVGVLVFDRGDLATPEGGIDFAAVRQAYAAVLHRVPRYRQKVTSIPGEERAVWVDDPNFSLDYHMRHTALPRPGSEAQLKTLVSRIMEHPLDRSRPLWETWVVEGLCGGRFAILNKAHHCLVDGASSNDILTQLFAADPDRVLPEAPRFVPRPPPTRSDLWWDAWRRRVGLPAAALRTARRFLEEEPDVAGAIARRAGALAELARWKLVPASHTPLNGPVGPHRTCDWLDLSLDDLRAIRKQCGVSINDVVLAIVNGAVREFMIARQVRPESLDFRVSAPVSMRGAADEGRLGNRVSSWILRLPLAEDEPLAALAAIHAQTQALKDSGQAIGVDLVNSLHEWVPIDIQSASKGTQNLLVTNVPGPPFPLYLLGARMRAIYVQAPLIQNVGMAIGVFSYDGRMFWGFDADYDRVPDLASFAGGIRRSFDRLAAAAGVTPSDA
jgi:diacylglycerol O-acyltransferase / wax synthase